MPATDRLGQGDLDRWPHDRRLRSPGRFERQRHVMGRDTAAQVDAHQQRVVGHGDALDDVVGLRNHRAPVLGRRESA